MALSVSERFWIKVERRGPEACWLWTAALYGNGYGNFSFDGRNTGAHRAAWHLTHGAIPKDLYVLHRCDRKACVNPAHLFVGTQKDNIHDMMQKGRFARKEHCGERNPNSKLVEEEVLQIRRSDLSRKELACKFGVTTRLIGLILHRRVWKHL